MRLPLLAIAAIGCQPDPPPPEVWEREADYYVAHPILGHVHKPNATRVTAVPEHPDGQVTFRTNAAGFRNDREVAVPKPPHTFRVLVVGDSHTDGVVDNSEGFGDGLARQLDVAFAEHRISDHIDVINGGTGYWGPAQYGQAFSVWAHLEPDACVVMLYEGNDLLDAVAAEERAGKRHIGRLEDHYDRLYAVAEHVGERVSQQLNQDLLFAHAPSAAIDAVRLTREAIVEAHDTCAAFDAPLVVVRLPPSGAVHPPTPAETAHIQAILGPIPWLSGRTLADALQRQLAEVAPNVTVLDAWPQLYRTARGLRPSPTVDNPWQHTGEKAPPERVFWSHDHHLSTAGHAAVIRTLVPTLVELHRSGG